MDFIAQPLIILSICIGFLNLVERILKRTTKYNKLLDKVHKSRDRLIEISQHQDSIENGSENGVMETLGFIEDLLDLSNIDFKIPN